MEISIKKEELQQKKLFVATPMYGGMNHGLYAKACLDLQALCMQYGVKIKFSFLFNESLITRARNYCVDEFLRSDATHLMFIDADIRFEPESILRMLLADAGVICGLYPMKGIPIKYVLNIVPNARQIGDLFEVSTSGTGFMLINRKIIQDLFDKLPELKYKDSLNLGEQYEKHMYALFDTMIDENGHYLSEDWTFCKRVREVLRIPIWVDKTVKLDHLGAYNFQGDPDHIRKLVDEWTKNAEIKSADDQNKGYEIAPKES